MVAILSGAATFGFSYQFVFPILTASLQNEVASLRNEVNPVKVRNAKLESETLDLKVKLADAQTVNMLAAGNPYPTGANQVKLGDQIESVEKAYPTQNIKKEKSYWSVINPTTSVAAATYFWDAKQKISSILLHIQDTQPKGFLKTKLIAALGQPSGTYGDHDCPLWILDTSLTVSISSSNLYQINRAGTGICYPD